MTDQNVLYSDYKSFVDSIYGPLNTASSEFAGQILELKSAGETAALTAAQRYESVANVFYTQYAVNAARALKYAENAEAAGNTALANLAANNAASVGRTRLQLA